MKTGLNLRLLQLTFGVSLVAALSLFYVDHQGKTTRQASIERLNDLRAQIGRRIESAHKAVIDLGRTAEPLKAVALGTLPDSNETVLSVFEQIKARHPQSAFHVLNLVGERAAGLPPHAMLDFSGQAFFLAGMTGAAGVTGWLDPVLQRPALLAHAPLFAGDPAVSQIAGVLGLSVEAASLLPPAPTQTSPVMQDAILLLAPGGLVFASTQSGGVGERLANVDDNMRLTVAGQAMLASTVKVPLHDPAGEWLLVTLHPAGPAWLEARHALPWATGLAAFLGLALLFMSLLRAQRRNEAHDRIPHPSGTPRGLHVPYMEGVDIDQGLANAGNDVEAYLDRIRIFLDRETSLVARIHHALLHGNWIEAEQLTSVALHEARLLGANWLARHLENLQKPLAEQCHGQDLMPAYREAVESIDKTLHTFWSGLEKVGYGHLIAPEPPPPSRPERLAIADLKPMQDSTLPQPTESAPATNPAEDEAMQALEANLEALDFEDSLAEPPPPLPPAPISPAMVLDPVVAELLTHLQALAPESETYLKQHQVKLATVLGPMVVARIKKHLLAGDFDAAEQLCKNPRGAS